MATSPERADAGAAESLFTGVRGWLHDGTELLRVRLALLGTEAAEHGLDLTQSIAWAVAAAVLLSLGLGFAAVLLTVLLWDSHRVLALALFSGVFLTLGAVMALAARRRLAGVRWFEASAAELARDAERLRGRG